MKGAHELVARLLLLRALLLGNQPIQIFLKWPQNLAHSRKALIVDNAAARTPRDVQKGHIDEALEIARRPENMFETWKRAEDLDHTRAGAVQRKDARAPRIRSDTVPHRHHRTRCGPTAVDAKGDRRTVAARPRVVLRASLSMTLIHSSELQIRSRRSEARYHWIFSPLNV